MKRINLASPVSGDVEYYEFLNRDFRGKKVPDIGGGGGSFEKSKRFAVARKKLQQSDSLVAADLNIHERIDLVTDAQVLPFRDGCFDVVIAKNLFEHLRDPKAAVAEFRRAMAPSGLLLLTTPFLYPVYEAPNDYRRMTRIGLEMLFNDFESVVIKERGRVFSISVGYVWMMFRPVRIGIVLEMLAYPILRLFSRLDRFDSSAAFALILYGEATRPNDFRGGGVAY